MKMEATSCLFLVLIALGCCMAQPSNLNEMTEKIMRDTRNSHNDVIKPNIPKPSMGLAKNLVLSRMADLESENRAMKEEMAELKKNMADIKQKRTQHGAMEVPSAFMATVSSAQVTPSDPFVFDVSVFDVGGDYSTETGVFTVPLDGVYQFTFQYVTYESSPSAWLVVDGNNVAYTTGSTSNNLVVVQSLTAGQEVWVRPDNLPLLEGSDGTGIPAVWFSGNLIQ